MQLLKRLKRRGRQNPVQPVILITGCSSGIGLELAKLLWELPQYRVVITVRKKSEHKLEDQKFTDNDRFWIQTLEICDCSDRERLLREITERWGGVDILVNNAGISYRSVIEHMDEDSEKHQMLTNYFGPIGLIRLVLPRMRQRGRGKIINISSVSGMLAMPTMASYSASKYALEGASESLWYEMKPLGINVTLIQPGFIKSESFKNVYFSRKANLACQEDGPYADYYRHMGPFVGKMMNKSSTTADAVARKVIKVIRWQNPPLRVPATTDAIVFYYLRRWIPRRFFHRILFYLLPGANHWAQKYSRSRDR